MTIASTAIGHPILKPQSNLQFTDPGGFLTAHGQQVVQDIYKFIVAMNRLIPCNASGTNTITLTQLSLAPLVDKYVDFEVFTFVAANSSTGDVSAKVVLSDETELSTLNVYKDGGSTRAGNGDITSGRLYFLIFNDALNSAAGGFVLK